MKVALVVDWLQPVGGSEAVLGEALRTFPGSSVYALFDQMGAAEHERLGIPRVHTSWIQRFVGANGNHRPLLPLMPMAARSLAPRDVDVVLAISHAVAQHVRTRPGQKLLSLSLSPMRYAWDLRDQYLAESGLDRGVKGALAHFLLDRLRASDLAASRRVHAFASISHHIVDRVKRAYGRDSVVIYPPVDTEYFTPTSTIDHQPSTVNRLYVTASRFVPYKRVDLIVRAFAATPERRLVVIGDGPDAAKVHGAAEVGGRPAANITFLGQVDRATMRETFRGARAFVFAAEEDFGITPLEAQACGVPVIGYGRGGLLETVVPVERDSPTGVFFAEHSVAAIVGAVDRFESNAEQFRAARCRLNAERFSAAVFRNALAAWVRREA